MNSPKHIKGQLMVVPRPVHPRSANNHGFLGLPYVKQHMMVDTKWTPLSLTEQFKRMADVLQRRLTFQRKEAEVARNHYSSENRKLLVECRDGRKKLQLIVKGYNMHLVRNYLINHKGLQCLYQDMPLHLTFENINQRTFVLRKERDRLHHKMKQLKAVYKDKILTREEIQVRITFEDEFVLDEETRSLKFYKLIENSNVRLRAFKTINSTYKKMLEVLRNDETFYEPILNSLMLDMNDQTRFIEHILFLGKPAIGKFAELSEEYRKNEELMRKSMQRKLHGISQKKGIDKLGSTVKPKEKVALLEKHYVRETESMTALKNELEEVEDTIKQIQTTTLCSRAKEIFPRIKTQVKNNQKLQKTIAKGTLSRTYLDKKLKYSHVLEGVLINNLSKEEISRLEHIKALQQQLNNAYEVEKTTTAYLTNRAQAYVLLRFSMWNINEIMRHVGPPKRSRNHAYPSSYLKLPLLKFEMLTSRAVLPEVYEENLDQLVHTIQRKVALLMKSFKSHIPADDMTENTINFNKNFLESYDNMDERDSDLEEDDQDVIEDAKLTQNIPDRKQIKARSAKIVEDLSKKDD